MTEQPKQRAYQCARCGRFNPSYLAFETGWPDRARYWCLYHIPWRTRVLMRIRRLN